LTNATDPRLELDGVRPRIAFPAGSTAHIVAPFTIPKRFWWGQRDGLPGVRIYGVSAVRVASGTHIWTPGLAYEAVGQSTGSALFGAIIDTTETVVRWGNNRASAFSPAKITDVYQGFIEFDDAPGGAELYIYDVWAEFRVGQGDA